MPKKFIKSFKHAQAGVGHVIKTQRNIWIHVFFTILALAFAAWLRLSMLEYAIVVLAIFWVIVTEVINTSIEELVNILSPEHRVEAGLAKNIGAAAVLTAAFGAIIVGCIIFIPKLIK